MQILDWAGYKTAKAEAVVLAADAGSVDEQLDRTEGMPFWHLRASASFPRDDHAEERLARWIKLAALAGCFATVHGQGGYVRVTVNLRGEVTERETHLPASDAH